ncbi:hypothetical protein RBJ15_09440 [Pantoea sp. BS_4]|uniref:hypothetical protein n=1 Tax=Pantoea TaxID=53335 RepID=UPI00197DE82F|nr:hypothetical protein [Pantoea stewartii]
MSTGLYELFKEILENFLVTVRHLEELTDYPNDKDIYLHSISRVQTLRIDIEKSASLISKHYAEKGEMVQLYQLYNTQLALSSCISDINEATGEDEARDDLEMLKSEIALLEKFIKSKIK